MDFLNNNLDEVCHICGKEVLDQVISAVGYIYHPSCFTCVKCGKCLDGLKFTSDLDKNIFCILDYLKLHAPLCSKCNQFILPLEESEEIVRVVAMNKNYHIDCYKCQDCDMQLTDEVGKQCFPIDDLLFCYNCRLQRKLYNISYILNLDRNKRKSANGIYTHNKQCVLNNNQNISTSISRVRPNFKNNYEFSNQVNLPINNSIKQHNLINRDNSFTPNMNKRVSFKNNRCESNITCKCNEMCYNDNEQLNEFNFYLNTNEKFLDTKVRCSSADSCDCLNCKIASLTFHNAVKQDQNDCKNLVRYSNSSPHYLLDQANIFSENGDSKKNGSISYIQSDNTSPNNLPKNSLFNSTTSALFTDNKYKSVDNNNLSLSQTECESFSNQFYPYIVNNSNLYINSKLSTKNCFLSSNADCCSTSNNSSKTKNKNYTLNDTSSFTDNSISSDLKKLNFSLKKSKLADRDNCSFNILNGQQTNSINIRLNRDFIRNSSLNLQKHITNDNHRDSMNIDENGLYTNENNQIKPFMNDLNRNINIEKHRCDNLNYENLHLNYKIPTNSKYSLSENTCTLNKNIKDIITHKKCKANKTISISSTNSNLPNLIHDTAKNNQLNSLDKCSNESLIIKNFNINNENKMYLRSEIPVEINFKDIRKVKDK